MQAQNIQLKQIENNYDINIFTNYGEYYFDQTWTTMSPSGEQINKSDEERAANILEVFFESYESSFLSQNICSIYLTKNLKFRNTSYSIISTGESIIMALNNDSVGYSDDILLGQLHYQFASNLYNKYKAYFPKEKWEATNPVEFAYNKQHTTHRNGFLDVESQYSLHNDFSTVWVSVFNNQSKLPTDTILTKKTNLLLEFERKIKGALTPSILNTSVDIIENHNITIVSSFSLSHFPLKWLSSNYYADGQQIDSKYENSAIKIISQFLNFNRQYHLEGLLRNIYLVSNLKINDSPCKAKASNRSLYISIDSLTLKNEDALLEEMNYEYFYLYYKNIMPFFPKEKWNNIEDKNYDKNSAFPLFYDLYKYRFDSLNEEISSSKLPKKQEFFNRFRDDISKYFDSLCLDSISQKIDSLSRIMDVNIFYFTDSYPKWEISPKLCIDSEINLVQLSRYIHILEQFFHQCPSVVLKNYLENIYLLGGMKYADSNNEIGGTYDYRTRTIFLSNIGNSDEYLLGTIFHELSSIILIKNEHLFPVDRWKEISSKDEKSSDVKLKPNEDVFTLKKELHKNGYLNLYSTSYYENDFNEFSKLYFTNPQKLEELSLQYPLISKKSTIIKKFYSTIL